jgi:indole-3-glycerol phosphate synthase/phosphoribosylanthranilate isomerase
VSDILARIVAQTRADLAERRSRVAPERVEAAARARGDAGYAFRRALEAPGLGLIAEYKPRSPSRGVIREGVVPSDVIPHYDGCAAAISVLCDAPFFGGGMHLLDEVGALTARPLLCKDFVVDAYQVHEARARGAAAVLLMASVLDDGALAALLGEVDTFGMDALVEVHDDAELDRVLALPAPIVGVNSRNLRTMDIDHAPMFALLARIPTDRVRVAESGFASRADVDSARGRADAILMGSELMAATDIAGRLRELGW